MPVVTIFENKNIDDGFFHDSLAALDKTEIDMGIHTFKYYSLAWFASLNTEFGVKDAKVDRRFSVAVRAGVLSELLGD